MDQAILQSTPGHRERWLALLDKHGVGHAKALHVVEVRGACTIRVFCGCSSTPSCFRIRRAAEEVAHRKAIAFDRHKRHTR